MVVVIGGPAAAGTLSAGSVGTTELANAGVTTPKLADASVTIPKIGATGTASASTVLKGDGTWGSVDVTGQYIGSAATFAALPTAGAANGDWAVLTADDGANVRGAYLYNGTAYSLAFALGSGVGSTVGTIQATGTAAVASRINRYDATGGALTPAAPAVGTAGTTYTAMKTDASANTVTIGGVALSRQGQTVTFTSDGTAWVRTDESVPVSSLPTPVTLGAVQTTATAAVANQINRYDATSGNLAPAAPAVGTAGATYTVRKTDASVNTVTVGGEVLRGQGDEVVFTSDGAAWVSGGVKTTRTNQANTYAALGTTADLPRWRRSYQASPSTAVICFVGDSKSDEATSAAYMFARLRAQHTRLGEALYGMTSDVFTDGVTTSGSKTFTSATANFTAADVGRCVIANSSIGISTTIASIDSATQVQLSANSSASNTGVVFSVGRHIVSRGSNGSTLAAWLADSSKLTTLVADNPALIVASWLTNDVRRGQCDLPTATSRLRSFITTVQSALPNTDILLHTPPTMLTTNVSALNWVQTSGGVINPAGLAQTYSDLIRQAHLAIEGQYANVAIVDAATDVFGAACRASHPLMTDQLHPSPSSGWIGTSPGTGGYTMIADYLARKIGINRGNWVVDPRSYQTYRAASVVSGGATYVDIGTSEGETLPAHSYPLTTSDYLFVEGFDSPIALSGKSIFRPLGGNIRISGLTGLDFSGTAGRRAMLAGNHPDCTTGDRQLVSVDLPSIAAGATVTQSVTVTGVATGDVSNATTVTCTPPSAFSTAGLLLLGCYPSGGDTVRLVINNPTGGAIDRPSEQWAFWVIR